MKPVMRHYSGEEDYARIRKFLQDTMILNGLTEKNWHPARLDYQRWHGVLNQGEPPLEETHHIWEKDGEIVGAITAEAKYHVFINIHPDHECSDLFGEMLAVSERHNVGKARDGKRTLIHWIQSDAKARHEILEQRGYSLIDMPETREYQNRIDLENSIPDVELPQGYSIRWMNGLDDLPGRSWCSWRAFHPDEPDEKYQGFAWYRNIQSIPIYNQELDLVVVTEEDEIVSFCTVWYDDFSRTAYFEPVGTMPEHQRKGLARANLVEGLNRLKDMGCKRAFVGGYSEAAISTYKSAGFREHDISEAWQKFFD